MLKHIQRCMVRLYARLDAAVNLAIVTPPLGLGGGSARSWGSRPVGLRTTHLDPVRVERWAVKLSEG